MSPLVIRRCVYGVLLASLSAAVLLQLGFPEKPSQRTRRVYETIESLPSGSRVLLSLDFDPSSQGELSPMAAAFVRHLAEKKHRIFFLTLWETGGPILQEHVAIVRREYPHLKEGVDFVNFGFKPGRQVVITNAMADLSKDFPTDARNISLKSPQMELTRNMRNLSEVDLIVSVGAGYPGTQEWVQYAATPKKKAMVAGSPGVQAPQLFPYVPGQLKEVLVAIKGAAEYEELLIQDRPHLAERRGAREGRRRMGPQVIAHVLIVGLIVCGNVISFMQNRKPSG